MKLILQAIKALFRKIEINLNDKQDALIQSGATVGQIAKITAVDDTGKPTEWEAVDMANSLPTVTASDNGKFLRVVNGAWAAAEIASAGGVSF